MQCSDDLYAGNATYAAITAIIAANLVLVAYIVLSLIDDRHDQEVLSIMKDKQSRKNQ